MTSMSLLLRGSMVLSLFLLLGFFAAYELMGIPGLTLADGLEVVEKRNSRAHRQSDQSSSDDATERPPLTSREVITATSAQELTSLRELTCIDAGYQLTDLCNVSESKTELLGALATFEDLGSVMFLDDVVDSLQASCPNNSWCLTLEDEKRLYTELGESYQLFCDMADCLVDIPDECLTDERRLVLASLMLMCRANEEDATGECLLAIRQMTHVAMADLYREIDGDDDADSCRSAQNKTCGGPCYELGWQLHCMCEICEHKMDMLGEFTEWQWFFGLDDHMTMCGINDTAAQCEEFIQPEVFLVEYTNMFSAYLDQMNPRVLFGISVSCLVGFGAIGILIWAFACRLRRRRDRVDYTEVKSSEIQALIDEAEETEDDQLNT